MHDQKPGSTTQSGLADGADQQRVKPLRGRRWQWYVGVAWLVLTPIAIIPIVLRIALVDPSRALDWIMPVLLAVALLPAIWLVFIAPLIDAGDPLLWVHPMLRMRIRTDRLMPWVPFLFGFVMVVVGVAIPVWELVMGLRWYWDFDPRDWAWIPVAGLLGWGVSVVVKRLAIRSIAQRRLCPYCRYPRGTSRVCTECGRVLPRRRHGRMMATGKWPRWLSWLPGNSPRAQEIFAHMTGRERSRFLRDAAVWGLWGGATFAFPLSWALAVRSTGWIITACVLGSVSLASVVPFISRQKRFLCSTTWARRHGITPQDLRRRADRSSD